MNGVQMVTEQVNSIARGTAEQSKGSKMIREGTEQVTAMVREIARSTKEQAERSATVLTAVERMKSMTDQSRAPPESRATWAGSSRSRLRTSPR